MNARLYRIGLVFLALLFCYGILRGQEKGILVINPIQVQMLGRFELTGRLDFAGFRSGDPSWMIGKGIIFQPIDPSLRSQFRGLEGKKVRITVEEVK